MVGHGHTEEEALEDARAALELSHEVGGAGGGKGHSSRPFDADGDLDALAAEQGVETADDFDALLGDFWPEDEGADDFGAALRGWRRRPEAFPARMQ